MDIVEDHSLTVVETDFEVPLLPFKSTALLREFVNLETGAFWLNHSEGLDVCSEILSLVDVLIWWMDLVR